jgi:hypothetical protein
MPDNPDVISTLMGAVGGGLATYGFQYLKNRFRGNRMKSAALQELHFANRKISEKIRWMGRDVRKHLKEVDKKGVVKYGDKLLFLGEKETFKVPHAYWEKKYLDMIEIIPEEVFSELFKAHQLVMDFQSKFEDLKTTFETPYGNKETMAAFCYRDLIEIGEKLDAQIKKIS